MKLAPKTINSISLRLKKIKTILTENNSTKLDEMKEELYEIIHEIEEERNRCYTSHED